jgi:hypothetical protein
MRILTCIFLTLCALLTGCNSYNRVVLTISETNGDPIPDASVQASPMYFFNPSDKNYIVISAYEILEPFPADGDCGTTDANGEVVLRIATKSPLRLTVFAQNFASWQGEISITKQGDVRVKRSGSITKLQVSTK